MQTTDAGGTPVDRPVRLLLERLREGTYYGQHALMNEAADEIERLRGIVPEVLERLNDELCAENEWLREQVGRRQTLVARLERIAEGVRVYGAVDKDLLARRLESLCAELKA